MIISILSDKMDSGHENPFSLIMDKHPPMLQLQCDPLVAVRCTHNDRTRVDDMPVRMELYNAFSMVAANSIHAFWEMSC